MAQEGAVNGNPAHRRAWATVHPPSVSLPSDPRFSGILAGFERCLFSHWCQKFSCSFYNHAMWFWGIYFLTTPKTEKSSH